MEGSSSRHTITKQHDPKAWRDKLSFWLLGFNNKMGLTIVITAAKDITLEIFGKVNQNERPRHCASQSTGVVLLAATLPAFIGFWIQSKLPIWFKFCVCLSIVLGAFGYILMAMGKEPTMVLTGVGLISLGFGMGDYELSKQSILYSNQVGRSFQKGTKASIVWGALYYAVLRLVKISMSNVFYSLLTFPLVAILLFWFLLRDLPEKNLGDLEGSDESLKSTRQRSEFEFFEDRFIHVISFLKHMMPYGFILLIQGFIYQGVIEFIYFRGKNILDIDAQYRFYIFIYNVGVYACLTTRNLLNIKYVFICLILQLITSSVFIVDAFFFFIGYLWCVLLLTYIQGIIAGVAYTSSVKNISENRKLKKVEMNEVIWKTWEYVMTTFGGLLAVCIHYVLSRTQEPRRP